MMNTTAATTIQLSLGNLRSNLERAVSSRWMNGVAIVFQPEDCATVQSGELYAIPGAYLSDASYTENPVVVARYDLDEAAELLEMEDGDLLSTIQGAYEA